MAHRVVGRLITYLDDTVDTGSQERGASTEDTNGLEDIRSVVVDAVLA
jgi:hypothetical protein